MYKRLVIMMVCISLVAVVGCKKEEKACCGTCGGGKAAAAEKACCGTCGGDKKADKEGKCGEGKCGGDKKADKEGK